MLYCTGFGSQPGRFTSYSCDWTMPFDHWYFYLWAFDVLINGVNPYTCTNGSISSFGLEERDPNPALVVRSKLVDEIVWIYDGNDANRSHALAQWVYAIDECIAPISKYPTGESPREAAWRTAVLGRDWTDARSSSPADFESSYSAFRTAIRIVDDNIYIGSSSQFQYLTSAASPFTNSLGLAAQSSRKLCRTSKGYIGLVPERT